MPLTGQHAAVVKPMSAFEPGSIRTMSKSADGRPFSILIGKLKGQSDTATHSFHFPKDKWTPQQARKWASEHGALIDGNNLVQFGQVASHVHVPQRS